VIERAVSFADGEQIEVADLPDNLREAPRPSPGRAVTAEPRPPATPRPPDDLLDGVTFKDAKERWVSSFERDYIVSLLRRHGGNISHAAREADIDRKYFRKLMKKYEIEALGAVGADDDDEP
jgi:transcriptional regulator of acetoin/glycerol metabolism